MNAQEGDEAGPDLFKDAQYIGRKLVLALFSMQNIDITYNQNKTSNQAGYLGVTQRSSMLFWTQADGIFTTNGL
ncbi:hypothetical protein [Rhodohalobacter sp.]|uniref:hypothetical protein n=1 Tax=Rhodohalobacter sp. TaxID=1974210 RepID=UPI002ACE0039|nr:hypothetical protein [Rhodohalobacter sp.]MDZ7756050.1 hypothetical protein [Rhodohalobacter sp.]